ncbi:MAG: WG repeat-containing protein [Bacteroidota bacterium]
MLRFLSAPAHFIAILIVIAIVIIPSSSVHAQSNDVHPRVLIPYNDHGEWGYCDTLGNLQINPQYEAANFFYSTYISAEEVYLSVVKNKWGQALLKSDGKLLLPKKTHRARNLYTGAAPRGTVYLLQKKEKYGIYQLGEGWLVKPTLDSLYPRSYNNWMLLKASDAPTFSRFNLETLQLEPTEIVAVREYWGSLGTANVATTQDGQLHRLTKEGMIPVKAEELTDYEDMNDVMLEEVPDDGFYEQSYHWKGERPTAAQLGVDEVIDLKDFSSLSYAARYGFQKAIIAKRNGKMGMLSETRQTLIPFEYDRISFASSPTNVYLEKDGLVGFKILFTHHPMIEARYQSLSLARYLPVSSSWRFALFQVTVNGQQGYVGENAVEYFKLE